MGTVGNRYTHGPGVDEPLALSNNKGNFYYHADGLGSIVALTDVSQEVVQDYQYYFFGDLKDNKNRIKQPYRYTAREWDKEVGLYFYRARYYDAESGRFTQKDPIGFRGGINLYNYVGANPTMRTDPFGLSWFKDKSKETAEKFMEMCTEQFNLLVFKAKSGECVSDDSINTACGICCKDVKGQYFQGFATCLSVCEEGLKKERNENMEVCDPMKMSCL